jgi:hypothetical protein
LTDRILSLSSPSGNFSLTSLFLFFGSPDDKLGPDDSPKDSGSVKSGSNGSTANADEQLKKEQTKKNGGGGSSQLSVAVPIISNKGEFHEKEENKKKSDMALGKW